MGRWEPDAAGRLRVAALELFQSIGYEETTVAQIADRAGVTARTFFRYFADKPEVLFAGSENLQIEMVAAVAAAAPDASPFAAIAAALDVGVGLIGQRSDYARQRHGVVSSNPALAERELLKMARLANGLAAALRDRGTPEPQASLIAEAGVAAFRVGFAAWATQKRGPSLKERVEMNLEVLADLSRA